MSALLLVGIGGLLKLSGSGYALAAVDGGGTGAGGDEEDGDDEERQGVLGGCVALVEVDGDEGYEHVAGDHEGGKAGEQAEEEQEAAQELGGDGDVA